MIKQLKGSTGLHLHIVYTSKRLPLAHETAIEYLILLMNVRLKICSLMHSKKNDVHLENAGIVKSNTYSIDQQNTLVPQL